MDVNDTIGIMAANPIRAVVRLRTVDPYGLNPPQTEVVERLQALNEVGVIDDLDIDLWGASMGITQTDDWDPVGTRETVTEFKQWADEQGYRLSPAFDWSSADVDDEGMEKGQVVTPLITLAIYGGERLRTVYPHVNGEEVNTIHDGLEALESTERDTERSEDENKN